MKRSKARALTDKDGNAELYIPPGMYSIKVIKEGFEPAEKIIEFKSENEVHVVETTPITKAFIRLKNGRIRALIRSSRDTIEISKRVKESELLIDLATPNLKKDALQEFEATTKLAENKIKDLRRLESSTSAGVDILGIAGHYSKSEKKRTDD